MEMTSVFIPTLRRTAEELGFEVTDEPLVFTSHKTTAHFKMKFKDYIAEVSERCGRGKSHNRFNIMYRTAHPSFDQNYSAPIFQHMYNRLYNEHAKFDSKEAEDVAVSRTLNCAIKHMHDIILQIENLSGLALMRYWGLKTTLTPKLPEALCDVIISYNSPYSWLFEK